MVLTCYSACESPGNLVKMHILIQEVLGGVQDSAFPTSLPMMLALPAHRDVEGLSGMLLTSR